MVAKVAWQRIFPPPIPKLIDTAHAIDELPEYDSFEPVPDDF